MAKAKPKAEQTSWYKYYDKNDFETKTVKTDDFGALKGKFQEFCSKELDDKEREILENMTQDITCALLHLLPNVEGENPEEEEGDNIKDEDEIYEDWNTEDDEFAEEQAETETIEIDLTLIREKIVKFFKAEELEQLENFGSFYMDALEKLMEENDDSDDNVYSLVTTKKFLKEK